MWLFAGLAIFGIAFAALFPVARRLHAYLDERGIARGFTVGLLLLLFALVPIAGVVATASDRLRERRLDETAGAMMPVLEAVSKGAIGPLDESAPGEMLTALLRGREIRRQPRIRYIPLELGQRGSERLSAEGNFPFRVLNRTLRAGESLGFPFATATRLSRLGFALPATTDGLTPILDVVITLESGERRALVLDGNATRFHGWGEGIQLVEVRQLDVDPPVDGAVSVAVRPRGMSASLLGVCGFDGQATRSLTPEDLTRTGLPVRVVANPAGKGVSIAPGGQPVEFNFDNPVDCDRLWLVYEASDPRSADYRWFGEDIIDARLDYADGRPSEQHTLKHGEDLHSANLDRSRHAEDLQSVVAFVGEEDGVRTHTDQRLWVFSGTRKLKKISFRNLSGSSGYAVNLVGLTAGVLAPAEDAGGDPLTISLFVKDGEKTRLKDELAARFLGVRLAYADRRGIIRATEPDAATHIEGASIEEADIEGILAGRVKSARCGSICGIDADVSLLPVKVGDVVAGGLILFTPEANRAARRGAFDLFPAIAAILTLPYLLVSFAESLSRGDRIRRKISVALAVATVVPLFVVFMIVRGAFESSREGATQQKLNAEMQLMRERFVRERELAASNAAAFFRAFREHPRVEPLFLPPARPDSESTFRRELKAARERLTAQGRTFVRFESRLPGTGGAPWKTIDDVFDDFVKLGGSDFQGTDYYFVNGKLVLVGVDRWSQGESRGRIALGTEVTIPRESVNVAYILDLTGTIVVGEDSPAGLENSRFDTSIANAIRSNKPAPVFGGGIGLVDVFRDRDGNPAFAFVAFERPPPGEIVLFGGRISLGLLLGFVTVLGAVGALAVARILTDRLTIPIEKLASASQGARAGRGFVSVVTDATDEIGVLTEQFQAMSSELVRRIQHLDDIQRGMLGFAGRLNREEVAREACRFAAVAASAESALLWIPEPQWKGFRVFDSLGRQRQQKASRLVQRIVASDAWTLVADMGAADLEFLRDIDKILTVSAHAVWGGPVRLGRRNEGWLLLLFRRIPDEAKREAARAAANSIALVLENSRTYEMAIEDPLTGAFVEQHFELRLSESVERARALGRDLWIVRWSMSALDGNRTQGDRALQRVARRMVRYTERSPAAFVGRTGPLALTIVAEEGDALRRSVLIDSLRRLSGHQLQGSGFEFSVSTVLFPDDAPSTEAILKRLKSGDVDTKAPPANLEHFTGGITPSSAAMRDTVIRAARLSQVDIAVLLEGEPGVGKLELARRMHRASSPADANLVEVHLGTLNPNLAEADLFGVEAGAFSGADKVRKGLLESANGGTLVLNEIGDASSEIQAKLLRALQDRRIRRLGSEAEISLMFRLISTSSIDLKPRVQEGLFRQDLFYRIAGAVVHVPPLRACVEDIPRLANQVLTEIEPTRNLTLTPKALDRLMSHSWPGNLTEFRGVLRRAAAFADDRAELDAEDLEISRVGTGRRPFGETAVAEVRPWTGSGATLARSDFRLRRTAPEASWNDRQKRLLAMLDRGERITTTEYIRMMRVSPRTGLRDLAELVRIGRLRREGQKRGTTYRLVL